jgi:hypothetical protein
MKETFSNQYTNNQFKNLKEMNRKLLSLLALLMTAVTGAWADADVTWNSSNVSDINFWGGAPDGWDSYTKEGVTLRGNADQCDANWANYGYDDGINFNMNASGGYTFIAPDGKKFTKIEMTIYSYEGWYDAAYDDKLGSGWPSGYDAAMTIYETNKVTWTGDATSTVDLLTDAGLSSFGGATVSSIEFYFEAPPATYDVTANLADGAYWATFYTEAGNYQAPEGTQVFAVNLNTSTAKITMAEIEDRIVKSGEGVVLKKSTTGSITMTLTATAPAGDFSANSLQGTMTEINTTGANNYYVLNNGSQGVGFYKLSNTSGTIGANKAYLTYSGSLVREFFLFEDDATSINEELGMKNEELYEGAIYNLAGQRIQKMQKGINIVNGKKVLK